MVSVQPISLGTWRQSIIFRDMTVSPALSRDRSRLFLSSACADVRAPG
jgi:hypothetical protein